MLAQTRIHSLLLFIQTFVIHSTDLIGESPPMNGVARQTRGGKSKLKQLIGHQQVSRVTDENSVSMFSVSMRHAFVPFKGSPKF